MKALRRFWIWILHIPIGIRNIIYWIPVIWNDNNYDSMYTFDLIEYKLKYIRNSIKNGPYVDSIRDSEYIDIVIKLIKSIKEDYYELEYYEYCDIEYKFEEVLSPDGKVRYSLKSNILNLRIEGYYNKYPLVYKTITSQYGIPETDDEKVSIAMRMSNEIQEKASRLLFKILEDKIKTWW